MVGIGIADIDSLLVLAGEFTHIIRSIYQVLGVWSIYQIDSLAPRTPRVVCRAGNNECLGKRVQHNVLLVVSAIEDLALVEFCIAPVTPEDLRGVSIDIDLEDAVLVELPVAVIVLPGVDVEGFCLWYTGKDWSEVAYASVGIYVALVE